MLILDALVHKVLKIAPILKVQGQANIEQIDAQRQADVAKIGAQGASDRDTVGASADADIKRNTGTVQSDIDRAAGTQKGVAGGTQMEQARQAGDIDKEKIGAVHRVTKPLGRLEHKVIQIVQP